MDTIACELAKAKLQILEAEISQRESQNGEMRIMITADTLVILDDQIMASRRMP
jgi:predicted house-cleaning NTP pyrophosphatase (Maf/HAM1 superfamily)